MKKFDNLLLISLDGMSDADIAILRNMPNFQRLLSLGMLVNNVDSVFLTNTYPVHTSVITGCYPKRHRIIENIQADPGGEGKPWYWDRKHIKTTTLYDEARKKGLTVASVFWPVTAYGKIKYNIPEIQPFGRFDNQVLASLRAGNPWTTAYSFLKFGKRLLEKKQPVIDDFATAAMVSLIERRRSNLNLIHLLDVDSHKHKTGVSSIETLAAVKRMDARVGMLDRAMKKSFGEDYNLIIFSDHGALDVERKIDLNHYLESWGYLTPMQEKKNWEVWFRNCGGSAFLYTRSNSKSLVTEIRSRISQVIADEDIFIKRILSSSEMDSSGYGAESALGVEARLGSNFLNYGHYQANHGYSIEMADYKVFYYLKGSYIAQGIRSGGSLLDIAPIACLMLDLDPWLMDGSLRTDLLKT